MNAIQVFEANTKGRDFVIGDLHGSHSILINLLANLSFDGEVDRLFSVGDLVDRGPDNELCLELLREPWFHSVVANHEQMMIQAFHGGYMGHHWVINGGMWAYEYLENFEAWKQDQSRKVEVGARKLSTKTQDFLQLINLARQLPYLITVKRLRGDQVHIIHAELPPGHVVTDEELSDSDKLKAIARIQTEYGDFISWGRHRFQQFHGYDLKNSLPKVVRAVKYVLGDADDQHSHIISGHTPLHAPMTIFRRTNIDTGAVFSYPSKAPKWCALTCLDINEWRFYQATETEFREIDPVVVNNSDVQALASK